MVEQGYVSDELTHFVGRSFNGQIKAKDKQYQLLKRILQGGQLGVKHATQASMSCQHRISSGIDLVKGMVCFCDIPVNDLSIHMGKYSRFGLAFSKTFLVSEGASPVYYIASNSLEPYNDNMFLPRSVVFNEFAEKIEGYYQPRSVIFDDSVRIAMLTIKELSESRPEEEDSRDLTTIKGRLNHSWNFLFWMVLNYCKFYQEGLAYDDVNNYYMEREWRLRGILFFKLSDVKRVFVPEIFTNKFKRDFPGYSGEITFS